jgi:hypothetical protein
MPRPSPARRGTKTVKEKSKMKHESALQTAAQKKAAQKKIAQKKAAQKKAAQKKIAQRPATTSSTQRR